MSWLFGSKKEEEKKEFKESVYDPKDEELFQDSAGTIGSIGNTSTAVVRPLQTISRSQAHQLLEEGEEEEGQAHLESGHGESFLSKVGVGYAFAGAVGLGYGAIASIYQTRKMPLRLRLNGLMNNSQRYGVRFSNMVGAAGVVFVIARFGLSFATGREDLSTTTLASGITASIMLRTNALWKRIPLFGLGTIAGFTYGTWKGEKLRVSDFERFLSKPNTADDDDINTDEQVLGQPKDVPSIFKMQDETDNEDDAILAAYKARQQQQHQMA
eukprot:TRINITY_DN6657_c0_g1_i1.p1 TRINITY_DN6657_c0_g1~~TRINITY_DN6657_c0_g1_i1.p1  ORF type:complete len:270 (+),score=60.29 TRINITY_DN6657_c0_g1_i1:81-890(+)